MVVATLATFGVCSLSATAAKPLLETGFSPNAALLLVVGGLLAMYAEFLRPGMLLPGAGGATAILLGLLSFAAYPIRTGSALLLGIGVTSLVWAGWRLSRGKSTLNTAAIVLASCAIAAITAGSSTLIDDTRVSHTEAVSSLSPWFAAIASITFGVSTLWLLSMVLRSFALKQKIDLRTMPGSVAVALDDLFPSEGTGGSSKPSTGRVWLDGETWQAKSEVSIKVGETVRVRGIEDLTVIVEPVSQ